MPFEPIIMQALYTYIIYLYAIMLWCFRHNGRLPVASKHEDYDMLCFMIHVCSITRIKDLQEEWGIKRSTIKAHYAREMRLYYQDHPKPLRKSEIASMVHSESCRKLDEAIQAREECKKSVESYFLHRAAP